MGKHILIISQYFYPEPFRINDIALELKKQGNKVTVLTGIPNYPEGKFYKGYGLHKKRKETWQGIDIIRIPLISRGHSSIRLLLNYYSFVFSGWFWCRFTKLKPDLIFSFEVSPMIQTLIGKWFSKRRKIPHYLYVQDLWPENLEVVGGVHNKKILNHYQKMSDKIYFSCTKIFAPSPSFVSTIQERVKEKNKVIYLPQYAEEFYKPLIKQELPESLNDDRIKVIFTGNIGTAQGLDVLPKLAKKTSDKICFVIVGDGRYKQQLLKDIEEVKNKFILIGRQLAEKIPELLACADIAFLSFIDNALFRKTIPAKLQSYMACAMPILAVAEGETKRIINEANCGYCFSFNELDAIVNKLENIDKEELKEKSKNSLEYFNKNFNKDLVIKKLINELEI